MPCPPNMEDFNVNDYIKKFEKDLKDQLPDHPEWDEPAPILKSRHKISYVNKRPSVARERIKDKKKIRFNESLPGSEDERVVVQVDKDDRRSLSSMSSNLSSTSLSSMSRKKQVACPLFLAGTCTYTAETCNMLHTLNEKFMPHCYHYLNYLCSRTNCPYLHINLGRKAGYCKDFTRDGFCVKGGKCEFYHVQVCETFKKYGNWDASKLAPRRRSQPAILSKIKFYFCFFITSITQVFKNNLVCFNSESISYGMSSRGKCTSWGLITQYTGFSPEQ